VRLTRLKEGAQPLSAGDCPVDRSSVFERDKQKGNAGADHLDRHLGHQVDRPKSERSSQAGAVIDHLAE
jgi:hypothetical protein